MKLIAATYDADGFVTSYVTFDDDSPGEGIEPILRSKRQEHVEPAITALRDAQKAAEDAEAEAERRIAALDDKTPSARAAIVADLGILALGRNLKAAQDTVNRVKAEADAMTMTAQEAADRFLADHPDYTQEADIGGNPGHWRKVNGALRTEPRPQPQAPMTAGEILGRMTVTEATALVDVLEQRGDITAERKAELTRER